MRELARRASLERSSSGECGSGPHAFRVDELMVELELNPILRSPGDYDDDNVEPAWEALLGEIRSHMAHSTSVVVRGWNPVLSMKLSKEFMALHFGSLGQRCQ